MRSAQVYEIFHGWLILYTKPSKSCLSTSRLAETAIEAHDVQVNPDLSPCTSGTVELLSQTVLTLPFWMVEYCS